MPIDGDTVQFVFSLSDSRRLLLINDSLGGCSVRAITFANNNIVNFPTRLPRMSRQLRILVGLTKCISG